MRRIRHQTGKDGTPPISIKLDQDLLARLKDTAAVLLKVSCGKRWQDTHTVIMSNVSRRRAWGSGIRELETDMAGTEFNDSIKIGREVRFSCDGMGVAFRIDAIARNGFAPENCLTEGIKGLD
jgi:hypothetical protein